VNSNIWTILSPCSPPDINEWWSHTRLEELRSCPKRWWLRHSRYPNWQDHPYPNATGKATILGRVTHALVEEFADFIKTTGKENISGNDLSTLFKKFSARSRVPKLAEKEVTLEREKNPRFFTKSKSVSISIQQCLNAFKRIILTTPIEQFGSSHGGGETTKRLGRRISGSEVRLQSDKFHVYGVIDGIVGETILEFKTGSRSESHIRQVELYALLYFHVVGKSPKICKIVYTDGGPSEEFSPDLDRLKAIEHDVRGLLERARLYSEAGSAPAMPDSESCKWCPVRHMCDEYWLSDETIELRLSKINKDSDDFQVPSRRDVQLTVDTADLKSVDGAFVRALTQNAEPVTACIGDPGEIGPSTKHATIRMLSALVRERNAGITVSPISGSETFWLDD